VDTWYFKAINFHSSFSKVFPLIVVEWQFLAQKWIYTVLQLMEKDDFTGRMTTDENRALVAELAPSLCFSISSGFSFMHCGEAQQQIRLSALPPQAMPSSN
jgi:hypothetical protein